MVNKTAHVAVIIGICLSLIVLLGCTALQECYTQTATPFVLKEGTKYLMWFSQKECGEGINKIFLASSKDGIHWKYEKRGPVLIPGPDSWDAKGVLAPAVIKQNGKYSMWYRGDQTTKFGIGYASSKDGIHWDKSEKNPVMHSSDGDAWDSKTVGSPAVVLKDGTYMMWYRGSRYTDLDGSGIGYASSNDGISWKKFHDNPIIAPDLKQRVHGDPEVLYKDGRYLMWFSSSSWNLSKKLTDVLDKDLASYGKTLSYAISDDGLVWEDFHYEIIPHPGILNSSDSLEIIDRMDNPMIIFDQGKYKVWFRQSNRYSHKIMYSESENGLQWKMPIETVIA